MKVEISFELLNEYLDGALSREDADGLEARLKDDSSARMELEALRTLRKETDELPAEIQPGRDLWHGIEEEIVEHQRGRTLLHFPKRLKSLLHRPVGLAAAALLLVVPSIQLLHYVQDVSSDNASADRAAQLTIEFQRAQQVYIEARNDVLTPLQSGDVAISEETLLTVRESLASIDQAVTDIQSALLQSPDNPRLARLLIATREKERNLLQQLGNLVGQL
jgi:hypothetical protein